MRPHALRGLALGILVLSARAKAACIYPAELQAYVGVHVSTTSARSSAPASFQVVDAFGNNCYYEITATIKIKQDSPAITFIETVKKLSPAIHTSDAPAQQGACYTATISASGGGKQDTDSAGLACWPVTSTEPCDTCPRDSCEVDPAACNNSPLLLALDDSAYQLTGVEAPVRFDINADGVLNTVGWTAAGNGSGFLAVDRNGNGRIDDGGELFGDATRLPDGRRAANGFEALAVFDSNGDEVVDRNDSGWSMLQLWVDRNHDGISESGELSSLDARNIAWLSCDYVEARRRDGHGNTYRYKSRFAIGAQERTYYDVYFVTAP